MRVRLVATSGKGRFELGDSGFKLQILLGKLFVFLGGRADIAEQLEAKFSCFFLGLGSPLFILFVVSDGFFEFSIFLIAQFKPLLQFEIFITDQSVPSLGKVVSLFTAQKED